MGTATLDCDCCQRPFSSHEVSHSRHADFSGSCRLTNGARCNRARSYSQRSCQQRRASLRWVLQGRVLQGQVPGHLVESCPSRQEMAHNQTEVQGWMLLFGPWQMRPMLFNKITDSRAEPRTDAHSYILSVSRADPHPDGHADHASANHQQAVFCTNAHADKPADAGTHPHSNSGPDVPPDSEPDP